MSSRRTGLSPIDRTVSGVLARRIAAVLHAPLRLVVAVGFVFAATSASRLAVAQTATPLDGAWTMTAIAEQFTVQQWSSVCGPAPVTGTSQPGGPVRVRSDGPELVIEGGRRTLRTDHCIDGMPTLASESHSTDGASWRTRCATPPSDPRRAVVNTAFFLTADGAIQVAETGRYEVVINSSRCIADVKRDASLRRGAGAAAATASPAARPFDTVLPPDPTAAPAAPPGPLVAPPPTAARLSGCRVPGNAARLEVRPSRKLLRLGDVSAFRAVVVDAEGCPTGTPIQWSIGALKFKDGQPHTATVAVEGGHLTVPTDLGDATFDVVATAAGRSARSSVEVTSPATYEALLAQSGLDRNGERDEPSVTVLATASIGATDVHAEDGARRRRAIFIAIVAALALVLGVVAVVGARRSRKAKLFELAAASRHADRMREHERQKREREERHAEQMNAHLESVAVANEVVRQRAAEAASPGIDSGAVYCPCCRREFQSGQTYCPFDSNRLVGLALHEDPMTGPSGGICPTCHRGYNPGVKVCPQDGDELVPAAVATVAMAPPTVRGKICPRCGGRFDGTAAFCGKDGTQLVLVN